MRSSAYERMFTLGFGKVGGVEVMKEETEDSWRKNGSPGDSIVKLQSFRSVALWMTCLAVGYEAGQPFFFFIFLWRVVSKIFCVKMCSGTVSTAFFYVCCY